MRVNWGVLVSVVRGSFGGGLGMGIGMRLEILHTIAAVVADGAGGGGLAG